MMPRTADMPAPPHRPSHPRTAVSHADGRRHPTRHARWTVI